MKQNKRKTIPTEKVVGCWLPDPKTRQRVFVPINEIEGIRVTDPVSGKQVLLKPSPRMFEELQRYLIKPIKCSAVYSEKSGGSLQ